MDHPLSAFQAALILSVFPKGAQLKDACYFQTEYLPAPVRVRVIVPDIREEQVVVLRLGRHSRHGVELEASLFPVLVRLGLPVPNVLAGPFADPNDPKTGPMTVLSLLPGVNLQTWSEASPAGLEQAGSFVIKAVTWMQNLTDQLSQAETARDLPRRDLLADLQLVVDQGGPWLQEPLFQQAVRHLESVLVTTQTPLNFSNGDYQPGNFLSDGERLTGFVDFEYACFEDPHIGFAKYRIYDLHPLNKAGIVERYLQTQGLTEYDFAPRMAVVCLRTLQRELPIESTAIHERGYREHVLGLLRSALQMLT